jgi:SAM-dependent methyltransferase
MTTRCEVCSSPAPRPVLDLGRHPLCDDLVPIGSDRECERYPIEILYCMGCCTVHQRYQVPKEKLFPEAYHYRARFTGDVLAGMDELVTSVEAEWSLSHASVLDVGCNDGSLLDRFAAKGAHTIGVEPTGAAGDAAGRGHEVIHDFFTADVARHIGPVDVITFTNVFAHIEDLPALLEAVALVMHEDTVLVIENHYLGAILAKNQFDTFYHEHPRTYSALSFRYIASSLDRTVTAVEFPSRYGGNIRVMISNGVPSTFHEDVSYAEGFATMRAFIAEWAPRQRAAIQALGRIPAKAFPGRAAILLALLGLTEDDIECVYEKPGSLKIGHYVPGTRIPIRSDDELFARDDVSTLLNLAWHIPAEIEKYLRAGGYQGGVVQVV